MNVSLIAENLNDSINLLIEKILGWMKTGITMLPNFIVAVVAVLLFYALARLTIYLISQLLSRVSKNEAVNKFIRTMTMLSIMIAGLFVALGILNLDKTVTSLLAGIGIAGLALGFAFQNSAANLISGISMAFRSPINVGDLIESNSYFGYVAKIGLRATTINDPQGQLIQIPNRLVIENPFVHYTYDSKRRVDLDVGISYGDDLEKVEQLVLECIRQIPQKSKDKDVEFFYKEFGSSSINFVVRYWIDYSYPKNYLEAQHEGIKRIKKVFDENDITIPFPIRTLDFGIKGGEKIFEEPIKILSGNGHQPS